MSNAALYALGSINLDFQVRAERWPESGETLFVSDYLRVSGGKAANRAFIARKLGHPAVLLGRVGDDDLGVEALRPLRAAGVQVAGVAVTRNTPTGVSMIVVRPDGDKTILLAPNANTAFKDSDEHSVVDALRHAPAGSVVSLDLEISEFVVRLALHEARRRNLCILLDPSPADNMRDDFYEYADWVTPNHTEAHRLTDVEVTDTETAWQAAQALVDRGARGACVKLADGGCVGIRGEERFAVSAARVNIVDKTGAGDAFAGGLAVAALEQQSTAAALRFAVAASTLAVTAYGSQAAYPDRNQLEEFLRTGRA